MSSQQASYLLREFYSSTGWNSIDNHYGTFTHQSRQVLDFTTLSGLHLSISSRPTSNLCSGLALSSLVPTSRQGDDPSSSSAAPVLNQPVSPLLSGQLGYLFSSVPLSSISTRRTAALALQDRIKFKRVVQSYGTEIEIPERPELREDSRPTWYSGERVDKRDYLLYGRLYLPSPRLDALYVNRLNATNQLLISLITVPSPTVTPTLSWQNDDPSSANTTYPSATAAAPPPPPQPATSSSAGTASRLSELEFKLQQDTGRWSTEYSYAVGDGMWGLRGLYNFGKWGKGKQQQPPPIATSSTRVKVVDEDQHEGEEEGEGGEMPTGLKGRWSAGGEVYFSAQERSAGLSTGLRFSTLPDSVLGGGGAVSQPPTTVTATLNPIMGQLSTAYAVQTSKDSTLASRFDFNMYSYDADLTVGGEWFQRKNSNKKGKPTKLSNHTGVEDEFEGTTKRDTFDAFGRGVQEGESTTAVLNRLNNNDAEDEVTAVLKVRASTNSDIAMTWEGRLGDFLVSLGIVADLKLATQSRGRVSPIRSVGLGISYWA